MEQTREFYQEEYENKKRSLRDIAAECNTYPNKIRRELIRYGFSLRDKSEAQIEAIKCGRHEHPTKGKERSSETKVRISDSVAKNWDKLDAEQKDARILAGKAQWCEMTEDAKALFQHNGHEAIRRSTKDGSKLEQYLLNSLRDLGYIVEFHRDGLLVGEKLQIDLFLPQFKLAVEIDGPSHFLPIWGQDSLEKNIAADTKKNKLLVTNGYAVLRIKNMSKTLSEVKKRYILEETKLALEKISLKFPAPEDRIISIEVR